ncbi:putative metallopeptidase, partial [Serratia nevei]
MAKQTQDESHARRPYPPLQFIESHQLMPYIGLVPANEVQDWMQRQIIDDAGSLFNPDHGHLADADLRFMWASSAFEKKGRHVL